MDQPIEYFLAQAKRISSASPTTKIHGVLFNATIGVVAAMFAMLLYIWFRFEWQFGLGAIVTTGHDVILMIGLYVALGLEFNLSSIAAILTVVGYSINDTVVVYDRVRENLRRYKKMPIEQLLDLSMNQTLSRTFLTGLSTPFSKPAPYPLTALYLFGGEVISSFTLAMIFGILVGTYSSIFVAGPLLIPPPSCRFGMKVTLWATISCLLRFCPSSVSQRRC